MPDIKVANRFARALFELAKERGEMDVVYNDFTTIQMISHQSRELQRMFVSPVVKADKKVSVINEVFSSLISNTTLTFLQLLTEKGRDPYITAITESYRRLYLENKNIVVARITTAISLDDTLRNKVKDIVKKRTGKEVQLDERVDPRIIGGYILRVGDVQDDTSVRGRLNRLQRNFKENRIENSKSI